MAKIDIERLKSAISLEDLVERCGVELKRKGAGELVGLCPFHGENTPSFTVTPAKQLYHCMGCGAGGDHINFVQDMYQCDFKTAAEKLQEMAGGDFTMDDTSSVRRESVRAEVVPDWVPAIPAADIPAPKTLRVQRDGEWVDTPVVAAWAYRDRDGRLHGYTCRVEFEKPDGTIGKDVIPVTWMRNTKTGVEQLRQTSLPKPRLLYGTELLNSHPRANIILVEGEKTADAARRLLANFPVLVVTWPGGGKAAKLADWSLLKGRKIVCWPDCDSQLDRQTGEFMAYHEQPGVAAMITISRLVDADVRIVRVPEPGNWSNGWDLADGEAEGWTGDQVMAFIKQNLTTADEILQKYKTESEQVQEEVLESDVYQDDQYYDLPVPHLPNDNEEPFRILGWDRGQAYYLPKSCRQVISLSSSGHTKLNLLSLAPLRYWREWYTASKKGGDGVDWEMAADSLIQRAQAAGIWNPELVRGRGAWFDDGRSVVHAGDKVIIDGEQFTLQNAPTQYVYEAGMPMSLAMGEPMANSEAKKFSDICEALRWERKISGRLLAGWVFLAPICGALDWRPHIWITGGAGSGKSTVLSKIMTPALGETMVSVQGDTTEAGLRMKLKTDALPVVFDEFESEREKSAARVQDVMALLTQASSDTGASILKGGMNGQANTFKIRSMFAFASIGVNIKQHAARTRVTVLSLVTPPIGHVETEQDVQQYNKLIEIILNTLTDDYITRLQARAVRMIPIIRKNARVFSEAAAMSLGTRRMGDQIGTLLAGAYALFSQNEITRDEAAAWINQQDWSDVTDTSEERDEISCLNQILSHSLRVEVTAGSRTRTVGELVEKLASKRSDHEIDNAEALDALGRIGIRVEVNIKGMYEIWVANTHKEIGKILNGTNYVNSWARVLLRINGAYKIDTKKYAGVASRGVAVPLDSV